jgi:hypothetical protein
MANFTRSRAIDEIEAFSGVKMDRLGLSQFPRLIAIDLHLRQ